MLKLHRDAKRSLKKFLVAFLAILVIAPFFMGSTSTEEVKPEYHHQIIAYNIAYNLSRLHYNRQMLTDSLSAVVFHQYIYETLDPSRYYFYATDIEAFEQFRTRLDNLLQEGKLGPAFYMFNVFKERVKERTAFAKQELDKPFDFSKNEEYRYDRDDSPWAANRAELDDIWRQKVKYDALNLRLAGKDDAGIRETLKKRYENLEQAVVEYDSEEVFELFMNAFTESFDPHTNYFSPINSENFKIRMSLSLEGIGARLTREGEYTNVYEVVPGGPADKSGLIKANDKIIGVGQGDDGEMVDVIGWKLNDVVQKIRGKKGTTVRLQVIPEGEEASGKSEIIHIVRDEVKLEDKAAKADTMHIELEGRHFVIGVIDVPSFYSDFDAISHGEKNFKSTTRDVEKLIEELKEKNIDGLIIDLRNNGGGSLTEAISMTGLFIENGPVVQVKESDGTLEVKKDTDPGVLYNGPLGVMVNRFSASASEIFAAAIQDYERGIIIGNQTFGKGTVQNLIPLNRLVRRIDEDKLGQLKLTVAKFYRINGGSTQHKGVIPDISFPERYHSEEYGEASQPTALPWDEVSPSRYKKYGNIQEYIDKLSLRYKVRASKNREFTYYKEDIAEAEMQRKSMSVSLSETVRKSEREKDEAERLTRANARRKAKGLEPLKEGDKISKDDEAQDFLLEEGARIVADMILLSKDGLTGYFK